MDKQLIGISMGDICEMTTTVTINYDWSLFAHYNLIVTTLYKI